MIFYYMNSYKEEKHFNIAAYGSFRWCFSILCLHLLTRSYKFWYYVDCGSQNRRVHLKRQKSVPYGSHWGKGFISSVLSFIKIIMG